MKVLCVAEKNSIAKEVARILGGGRIQTSNSPFKYVKNYQFTFNFPQLGNCDVTMTSVAGHLSGMDFPEAYKWGRCSPGKLFEAPIIVTMSDDQKKIAQNIERLGRGAQKLMIWTDCDREGEYIGKEILDAAKRGNPSFTLDNTLRAHFSHLERGHILKAAREPKKLDKNAINAVETRMELDLRTGASFTRFLCEVFQKYRTANLVDMVSYGSCQFPTIGFVVDRFKRIKNFVPEEFWYLDVSVRKGKVARFTWKKNRLFDRLAAVVIYQKCMEHEKGTITNIRSQPATKYKPLPLTTVELQKGCSMYFKMSAKESLEVAEKLYQKGFLSYPRTETNVYPKTMDLKALIDKQKADQVWGEYATGLLDGNMYDTPRQGKRNDEAHPPIHPVNYLNVHSPDATATEKKVYEFVVRHFLATCSKNAKGASTNVDLTWGTEKFSASGLQVLELNYLDIYKYHAWKSSAELPEFALNEQVKINSAELKSGKTTPPQHITETELIALMDANGIGTDATIADHIEKVCNRQYIIKKTERQKKFLVPSTLGMALVDGFEELNLKNSLTKPFLRKSMEEELQAICDGAKRRDAVSREMVDLYRESFALSVQHQNVILNAYQRYRGAIGEQIIA